MAINSVYQMRIQDCPLTLSLGCVISAIYYILIAINCQRMRKKIGKRRQ